MLVKKCKFTMGQKCEIDWSKNVKLIWSKNVKLRWVKCRINMGFHIKKIVFPKCSNKTWMTFQVL